MKSRILNEAQKLQRVLSKNSWTVYRKLLGRVLEGLTYSWATDIAGTLRSQDVGLLFEKADSLSKQKYLDATEHFVANQVALLIKKYPFPQSLSPFDPEAEARSKFESSERNCARMNSYFNQVFDLDSTNQAAFTKMRAFIRYVLSDSPPLASIYESVDFGPGASIGVHGNATNVARKFESRWSVTPSAFYHAYSAAAHDWSFLSCISGRRSVVCLDPPNLIAKMREKCTVVNYNKIAFVPKTAKTHRGIAVEPLLNGLVQKGIDIHMRRRLLRIGIDLSDQSINAQWARLGSLDDSEDGFVTIDLSSASDSISIGLVRNLLPPDWFRLLDDVRSPNYLSSGSLRAYEKFCSMGNGFCFPLETLLFAAAAHSVDAGVPGRDFVVYGDDIIVRKRFAHDLISLLETMGFSCNLDKTFLSGPFRESCGSDWFNGEDVRPFTLDFALDSLENIFKFLNLTERSSRTEIFFSGVRDFVISLIPEHLRFVRPYRGNADSGYTVSLDEFMSSPYARWDRSLQCWSWYELHHRAVGDRLPQHQDRDLSLMIAALRGSSSSQPFTVRRKTRTTVRRVAYG